MSTNKTLKLIFRYSEPCEELLGSNVNITKNIIEKIYSFFPELIKFQILIYFTHTSDIIYNRAATMIPIKYPKTHIYEEFPDLADVCDEYSNLDFAIYVTRHVIEGNEIRLVIDLSHEFQHVFQYVQNKKIYFYACIIRDLLRNKINEVSTPIEYDAERESKVISYNLCGEDRVNEFIDNMIANPDIKKMEFFEIFKSIKIDKKYNLKDEVLKLWSIYGIEDKINNFKRDMNINSNQKSVIEMYDFADT